MPADIIVPCSRLHVFGDALCLRDPRGRGPNPALVARTGPEGPGWLVRGPFTVLQRFDISPEEGRAFVETSRDENPIHTQDTVVSGAMTASRLLLLPEVLVPHLAVRSARVRFRAFSRYDRPTVNRFSFLPAAEGGLKVELEVLQQGVTVAEGVLHAALRPAELAAAQGPGATTELLRRWLWSLRMCPRTTLEILGSGYPRAFLASLPSGEMVRMGGAGGLLNALDFEFPELGVPGLAPDSPPTVEVETGRPRHAFRKVLAKVAQGMVTYVRGSATVLLDLLGRGKANEAPSPA